MSGIKQLTPLEILTSARTLLTPPENWTQEVNARNSEGKKVIANSPYAVCWCAMGALRKAQGFEDSSLYVNGTYSLLEKALIELHPYFKGRFLYEFNDEYSHTEVLAVFDRAIALASESPPQQT